MVVKKFVLAKNHRIVNRHRFEQHAVSIFNGRRRHHHQAGIMRVNRLQTLAVKRPAAGRAAEGQPHGDRARHVRAPEKRRGLVDNLVETDGGKIRELDVYKRQQIIRNSLDSGVVHRV